MRRSKKRKSLRFLRKPQTFFCLKWLLPLRFCERIGDRPAEGVRLLVPVGVGRVILMARQQTGIGKIRTEHGRGLLRTEIIQVVALVAGVRVPVDRYLFVCGVEIEEADAQRIGKRLRAVVTCHVPVERAGRADEQQLRAVFVTEALMRST